MAQPITVVDAFADAPFSGNPAAVCVLSEPADESWMQAVATELNLPMTAFVAPRSDGDHDLRWFSPTTEVAMCGHATLASMHVLDREVRFHTKSGLLTGGPVGDGRIEMAFPAIPSMPVADEPAWAEALGLVPEQVVGVWAGGEWGLVELALPADVRAAAPDRTAILDLGGAVIAVATPGEESDVDSVCRVFSPSTGNDEDAVTGSAHCVIGPWLAARTGRTEFTGRQASARGGTVTMRIADDRVILGGRAVTVLEGTLRVDPR
jgi:predicted PhzF superfamily epimerase YddE/YHI9